MGLVKFMKRIFFCLLAVPSLLCAENLADGVVKPNKQVIVSSPVLQELIQEVLVEEGDEVKQGQILVQLRNQREALAVQQAEKLIVQKEFVARGMKRLFKDKMGSEEKALAAETDLELAKLGLEARKIELEEKSIRAPLTGIVVKKHKETGEAVDRTEKLVELVDMDTVFVEFFLKPQSRETVKEDKVVRVKIVDLGGVEFDGKITFIAPINDAGSGLFRVKVHIPNADHRIKPNMKAVADFDK